MTHSQYISFGQCKEYYQSCGICIDRCPAGAINYFGHDKMTYTGYLQKITAPEMMNTYGMCVRAGGLCQTGVPGESEIPKR